MIKSVKATGGYAAELPALKGRTFEFTPGVNVLFGPNGCGKSTIARIAALYSGCTKDGGWPRIPVSPLTKGTFPGVFEHSFYPNKVKAEVEWDGTATFYTASDESDAPLLAFGMPSDGLIDEMSRVFMRRDASSGQNRNIRINKLGEVLTKPPDLVKGKLQTSAGSDTDFRGPDFGKDFRKYVKSLPRKGPITLVADEIERSLDIPSQAIFLTRALPNLSKKLNVQVIIAAHSPFSLLIPGANIIDVRQGYVAEARKFLNTFSNPEEFRKVVDDAVIAIYGPSTTGKKK